MDVKEGLAGSNSGALHARLHTTLGMGLSNAVNLGLDMEEPAGPGMGQLHTQLDMALARAGFAVTNVNTTLERMLDDDPNDDDVKLVLSSDPPVKTTPPCKPSYNMEECASVSMAVPAAITQQLAGSLYDQVRTPAPAPHQQHSAGMTPVVLPQLTPALPTSSQKKTTQQEEQSPDSTLSVELSPVKFTLPTLTQEQARQLQDECIPLSADWDTLSLGPSGSEQAMNLVQGDTLCMAMRGSVDGRIYERLHSMLVSLQVEHQILTVYQVEQDAQARHFVLQENEGMTARQLLVQGRLHANALTLLSRMVACCIDEAVRGLPVLSDDDDSCVAPEPTMDDGWMLPEEVVTSGLLQAHPRQLARLGTSRMAMLGERQSFDDALQPVFHRYQGVVQPMTLPQEQQLTARGAPSTPAGQVKGCGFADAATSVHQDSLMQSPAWRPVSPAVTPGKEASYRSALSDTASMESPLLPVQAAPTDMNSRLDSTERHAELGEFLAGRLQQACQDLVQQCDPSATVAQEAQLLQAAMQRMETTMDTLAQEVQRGVTEAALQRRLDAVKTAIFRFVHDALDVNRDKLGDTMATFHARMLEKLAVLEAALPVMGRPVREPALPVSRSVATEAYPMQGHTKLATVETVTASAQVLPEGSRRQQQEGSPPRERDGNSRDKATKARSRAGRGGDGGDPPGDDWGDDSDSDDDEGGGRNRGYRQPHYVDSRRWQLNTRHPAWTNADRFGGEGEKNSKMLSTLGCWMLQYNNLLVVLMPSGWEELRGQARADLNARALAHMMQTTLKGLALSGIQLLVNAGECTDPRDLPQLVFQWVFPSPTGKDVARMGLGQLSLQRGVVEFEQTLRICMAVKYGLPMNGRAHFQDNHYDEMLAIIRDVAKNTGCDVVISTLHTLAPQAGHAGGKPLPQLFDECLSALRSLEARKGREVLRPNVQDGGSRGGSGGQRQGSSSDGSRDNRRRDEDPRRPPQLNNMDRRERRESQDGSRGNVRGRWCTSQETGSLDLNGPPPDDAPPDCRTLADALARRGQCFYCLDRGHLARECPRRANRRQQEN